MVNRLGADSPEDFSPKPIELKKSPSDEIAILYKDPTSNSAPIKLNEKGEFNKSFKSELHIHDVVRNVSQISKDEKITKIYEEHFLSDDESFGHDVFGSENVSDDESLGHEVYGSEASLTEFMKEFKDELEDALNEEFKDLNILEVDDTEESTSSEGYDTSSSDEEEDHPDILKFMK